MRKAKIVQAYKNCFNLDDPDTSIVLQDMCKAHGIFTNTFDPDPCTHAFASGERNVVLRILSLMQLTEKEIINLSQKGE